MADVRGGGPVILSDFDGLLSVDGLILSCRCGASALLAAGPGPLLLKHAPGCVLIEPGPRPRLRLQIDGDAVRSVSHRRRDG